MRKARTILSIILVGAFLVLGIGGIQAQEPPKKEDTLSIIEALEKGYISEIGIEGSENEIKLSIERTSEKEVLNIYFPKGVTSFGFISKAKTITHGGWKSTLSRVFDAGKMTEIRFEYYLAIATDDFNSDGFYVDMDEPLLTTIPEGERKLEVSGKGKLKVEVPLGYGGFPLAGVSGTIVSGKIFIQKNTSQEKDEPKFTIFYSGNMRIRR